MKIFIILSLIFLSSFFATAQNQVPVSVHKTDHLVCPDRVSYLQVGDPSLVVAEVVPNLPNLVRIKARKSFEGRSSVTLVCAGKIYTLLLNCKDSDSLTYQLTRFSAEKAGPGKNSSLMPEYVLKELCSQLLNSHGRHIHNRKEQTDGIRLRLNNICQKNNRLFFELEITNSTNLSYHVEGFHWWVCDQRQLKATNAQQYQINPVYQYYNIRLIPGSTTLREVFVVPQLILPDKRVLRLEMLEKALGNTGRKLTLDIKNKDILRARKIR